MTTLYRREIDKRLDEIGHLAAMNRATPPQPFNLGIALEAAATANWRAAGAERDEVLRVADKFGVKHVDDAEILIDPARLFGAQRDLNTGTVAAGGALAPTFNAANTDGLRPLSLVQQLGARVVIDPRPTAWPRISTPVTATWLAAELDAIPATDPAFSQRAAATRWVGALTRVSRQLLLQSPVAGVIERELLQAIATAIDAAAFGGSGAGGQPTGIALTAGVGTTSGTSFNRASARAMQRIVSNAGGLRDLTSVAFVTTNAVGELLGERAVTAGDEAGVFAGALHDGRMAGVRAVCTPNCPAATVIYGDFSGLVVHLAGPVKVVANAYTGAGFRSGSYDFRLLLQADIVIPAPAQFCVASTVT